MNLLNALILSPFVEFSQQSVVGQSTSTTSRLIATDTSVKTGNTTNGIEAISAVICLVWYFTVLALAYSGWIEIMRNFRNTRRLASTQDAQEAVSIIRPCKGIETEMLSCLESCVLQEYPSHKFEVLFCVESSSDPCIPIIRGLIAKHTEYHLKLLVGKEGFEDYYGPNPKINNLSKAYRNAQNDIIWVLDANVWCSPGTLGRSVASLVKSLDNGTKTTSRPVVLTHHVPLALSISQNTESVPLSARLDEMFMFSSHAKFYVGFNKVSIAPCVNGKSNLYRRSDLDNAVKFIGEASRHTNLFQDPIIQKEARAIAAKWESTAQIDTRQPFTEISFDKDTGALVEREVPSQIQFHHHGIEFFSTYIGEDNMIGTALWDMLGGRTGMTTDAVVQPLQFGIRDQGLQNFIDRRVRWLRVRKYMVLAATLLEPTTECFFIGLMGSWGLSWAFGLSYGWIFAVHCSLWCITDRLQYLVLLRTIYADDQLRRRDLPEFLVRAEAPRSLVDWWKIWLLRELLALPIWIKAMSGSVIDWRNKPFRIKRDLTAEELRC
ncbi:LANO_0H21880g1_1 [Lachancea nothofagi CBS 11611]|uniref:Ceramide glucosyltransferase n=1 Tax=Lachancea nothofagi CBS 11611 TaxID=1266666 RepID=A0A1G4KNT3_9SACH|nr:LANO_0H21880g1_1 [Lachancea nothofagi CBS 11611]